MPFKNAVKVAKLVYKKLYWDVLNGDLIPHDTVAAPLLSFGVNDNIFIAVKALQQILGVTQDGHIGQQTISALTMAIEKVTAEQFRESWANFYRRDVQARPDKQRFLAGWLARVNFPFPAPPAEQETIIRLYQG